MTIVKSSLHVHLLCVLLVTSFFVRNGVAADHTVPFEKLSHLLLVKAKINGSADDYNFIVDTGGVACLDKKVAQDLRLKQRGPMAKIDTLELSGLRIDTVMCVTAFDFRPFDWLGTPIHGIIGSNLLERYKVTLDFKARSITFSTDTASLRRPDSGFLLTFRNHPVNNAPLVNFKMGDRTLQGMIDTGQPYPVVCPLESFAEHKDVGVRDFIKSRGLMKEWPMTTVDFNYLARLKSFELGNVKIEGAVCLFAQLPRMLSMPLIGNDFLSQFTIVINYPKDQMVMIPYPDLHWKENVLSIGLTPDLSKDKQVVVKGLWENSPADKAQLEVGDRILSFNAQQATQSNLMELINMMGDDATESITVEIENQTGTREVTLNKALLF